MRPLQDWHVVQRGSGNCAAENTHAAAHVRACSPPTPPLSSVGVAQLSSLATPSAATATTYSVDFARGHVGDDGVAHEQAQVLLLERVCCEGPAVLTAEGGRGRCGCRRGQGGGGGGARRRRRTRCRAAIHFLGFWRVPKNGVFGGAAPPPPTSAVMQRSFPFSSCGSPPSGDHVSQVRPAALVWLAGGLSTDTQRKVAAP